MNYEKAYKEALERARKSYNKAIEEGWTCDKCIYEQIFPELKESEDERVRQEIIDYIQEAIDTDGKHPNIWTVSNAKKWLEWLEKQGENHIVDKNETVKLTDKIKPKFDSSDWIIPDMSDETVKHADNAGTIEPKFKIGDWVVFNNNHDSVYKVEKIENYEYTIRHILGGSMPLSFSHEDMIREWTIEDVKDGDVLATEYFIFIFKNIDKDNYVHYYCHYEIYKHENDNQFDIALPQSLMGEVDNSHYSPATFEQRTLLFEKMKKAGWEWDANKKELKKIN